MRGRYRDYSSILEMIPDPNRSPFKRKFVQQLSVVVRCAPSQIEKG